jgi:hypothetical protein
MGPAQLAAGGAARAISPEVFGGARQTTLAFAPSQRGATTVGSPLGGPKDEQALSRLGQQPLSFEANRGQAGPGVDFVARAAGYSVSLSATEAVLALQPARGTRPTGVSLSGASTGHATAGAPGAADTAPPAVVRMQIVGGNATPAPTGMDELPGKVNYFIGNDPSRWHADVPTYAGVQYHSVYPGIDLVYHGNQGQLEYDFVVAPGADAGRIALNFAGADHVSVDGHGELFVEAGGSQIRETKPVVYQEVDGVRREIAGSYVLGRGQKVSFQVGAYDRSRALVIDPLLGGHTPDPDRIQKVYPPEPFTTYLGGSAYDSGDAVAVDGDGNTYVTGETNSADFPATNGYWWGGGYPDAHVSRFNEYGGLEYCTYLGGSGADKAFGIAVDTSGNIYVTGSTNSPDFPVTDQTTLADGTDAFVTEIDKNGSVLTYSTYLGGSKDDGAWGIALDSARNAYVTGSTASSDFPTTLGAYDIVFNVDGSNTGDDAFVTKISSNGTKVYSTYLGGSSDDTGYGIAVDSSGSAYVTGSTASADFPVMNPLISGTYSGGTFHGPTDAFVTKLSSDGKSTVYSTYLGGDAAGADEARGIAVDAAGSAYVTGSTGSASFPIQNPLTGHGSLDGPTDAFVTKLSADGKSTIYSTYLGGGADEFGSAIAVDASGRAYVTGETHSADFPVFQVEPIHASYAGGNGDAYVTKFSVAGNTLVGSGYLGGPATGNGNGEDAGYGITADADGRAHVTGSTESANFPVENEYDGTYNGYYDAFVASLGGPAGVG